jgi:hypothetical protein
MTGNPVESTRTMDDVLTRHADEVAAAQEG